MCECKEGMCALSMIYPDGDNSTYACDDECFFSYCDEAEKEKYIKNHPIQMKECGIETLAPRINTIYLPMVFYRISEKSIISDIIKNG